MSSIHILRTVKGTQGLDLHIIADNNRLFGDVVEYGGDDDLEVKVNRYGNNEFGTYGKLEEECTIDVSNNVHGTYWQDLEEQLISEGYTGSMYVSESVAIWLDALDAED